LGVTVGALKPAAEDEEGELDDAPHESDEIAEP
jgi:hypothetical protein